MRDIVKSIRTQSQMFRQMNNSVQADKLEGWAKYIEELRAALVEAQAKLAEQNKDKQDAPN